MWVTFHTAPRLELLQASRVCQLKLEVLSCSRLLDVKKDFEESGLVRFWLHGCNNLFVIDFLCHVKFAMSHNYPSHAQPSPYLYLPTSYTEINHLSLLQFITVLHCTERWPNSPRLPKMHRDHRALTESQFR